MFPKISELLLSLDSLSEEGNVFLAARELHSLTF